MRLHEDNDGFAAFIDDVSARSGLRKDVLEKDYYVMLFLEELSELQNQGVKAYFKGGTALYKALKKPIRFSEDIDLSVDVRETSSRTQSDKLLKRASKMYKTLPLDPTVGYTYRQAIEAVYRYSPCVINDSSDALERFGSVKVEATSFTVAEPISSIEVSYLLYDYANDEQRVILRDVYHMEPFEIQSLTVERIFVDKLFAAESYILRSDEPSRAADAAKHLFDLAIMVNTGMIDNLLSDEDELSKLLNIRMAEELQRRDGIPGRIPKDFVLFDNMLSNEALQRAYPKMISTYVFDNTYALPLNDVQESLQSIKEQLESNQAWLSAQIGSIEACQNCNQKLSRSFSILSNSAKQQSVSLEKHRQQNNVNSVTVNTVENHKDR